MKTSGGADTNLCSGDQGRDPREWLKLCKGKFRLDIKKMFFPGG